MGSEIKGDTRSERELTIEKILNDKHIVTRQKARELGYRIFDSISVEDLPDVYRYDLRYGSKMLLVTINMMESPNLVDGGEAHTYVQNTDAAKRREHETSILYAAARRLIEQESQIRKREILYTLDTNNPKMIAWAQTTGRQIFNWDTERVQTNDNYVVTGISCEKRFLPPEKK